MIEKEAGVLGMPQEIPLRKVKYHLLPVIFCQRQLLLPELYEDNPGVLYVSVKLVLLSRHGWF